MTSSRRFFAISLSVAFIATVSWFGVYTLVNAYVIKGLHRSDADWASITLWLSGGMVFWQVLSIELAGWIGRRKTVALSLASVAIGYAVIAFAKAPTLVGVMLGLMAFMQAAASVCFVPLLLEIGGDRPGRAFALYQWLVAAITAATLVFGGYFMKAGYYCTAFLTIAGLAALAAVVFYLASSPAEHGSTPVVSFRQFSRADFAVLTSGPFLCILILGSCMEPAYYHMVNQLFPNLARAKHHLGEDHIGAIVALGRLPSLVSLYFLSHSVDRLNPRRIYSTAMALAALAAIGIAWVPALPIAIGCYLIYYFVHGAVWGSSVAAINSTITPRQRDLAFLLMAMAQSGSAFLVGTLQQRMLAAGYTIPKVFLICGAIAISGAVALSLCISRMRTVDATDDPVTEAAAPADAGSGPRA